MPFIPAMARTVVPLLSVLICLGELPARGDDPKKDDKPGTGEPKSKDNGKKDNGKKDNGKKDNGKKDNGKKGTAQDAKVERFYHEYVLEEGDSLLLVARMFGVSMKGLRKWNKAAFDKKGMGKPGTTIKVYVSEPKRIKRKAYHEVKKGDTLGRLAKKYHTTVSDLENFNHLKKGLIKPGMRLVYLTALPEEPSESVGSCSNGRLVNGEKLPPGPGYSYGSRPNVYGTNETVTTVLAVMGRFRKAHPKAPVIVVGNLSAKGGRKLDPHKSHQSGRDVDVGYLHKKKYQPVTHMLPTDKDNVDVKLTWALIKTFLDTGKVKVIFMDYSIQEILYNYLKEAGVKKRYLAKLLQYPKGKGTDAIIKDVAGHHHHMHIRFVCPKSDKKCEP